MNNGDSENYKTHDIYKPEDFDSSDESVTARMVIEGGLEICKNCSQYEMGLVDHPCVMEEHWEYLLDSIDCWDPGYLTLKFVGADITLVGDLVIYKNKKFSRDEYLKRKEAAEQKPQFEKEHRYYVFKRKLLNKAEEEKLVQLAEDIGGLVPECVVVESDWPNYEEVWNQIEQISTTGEYTTSTRNEVIQLKAKIMDLEKTNEALASAHNKLSKENQRLYKAVDNLSERKQIKLTTDGITVEEIIEQLKIYLKDNHEFIIK